MKKTLFLTSILFCFPAVSGDSFEQYVSIYNIGDGSLIYTYANTSNKYVSANSAHQLNDGYQTHATWKLFYTSDGYVSFKNEKYSNLCLDFTGKGWQITQYTCVPNSADQKFELIPTSTSAVMIKVKDRNRCLYNYAGDFDYFVYGDTCPKGTADAKWLWAIIPALKSGTILELD